MSPLRPELARRIVREAAIVNAKFPGRFRLTLDAGLPVWEGKVPVEERLFPIRITYPSAYPAAAPVLETTLALPSGCPHVLRRQGDRATLCWIGPAVHSTRRRWDPQRHTAATVMHAAQRWALAFLVWQQIRDWPVADAWEV